MQQIVLLVKSSCRIWLQNLQPSLAMNQLAGLALRCAAHRKREICGMAIKIRIHCLR